MELGDMEQAQKHFQMVLDMLAQEKLRPCQEWAARDRREGAKSSRAEDGCGLLSAGRHAAVLRRYMEWVQETLLVPE